MALINAFNNTTGKRQMVPEHYLSNPALGDFTKEPRKKATPAAPKNIEPAKPEKKEKDS